MEDRYSFASSFVRPRQDSSGLKYLTSAFTSRRGLLIAPVLSRVSLYTLRGRSMARGNARTELNLWRIFMRAMRKLREPAFRLTFSAGSIPEEVPFNGGSKLNKITNAAWRPVIEIPSHLLPLPVFLSFSLSLSLSLSFCSFRVEKIPAGVHFNFSSSSFRLPPTSACLWRARGKKRVIRRPFPARVFLSVSFLPRRLPFHDKFIPRCSLRLTAFVL